MLSQTRSLDKHYRVRAIIRRLNHRPKTPAGSSDSAQDPYLRDTVILRARLSPSSTSFIPPSRRKRVKEEDEQKRRNETRKTRVFPRIRTCYSAHECVYYCRSGGGSLLIGLLTLRWSRSGLKETRISLFLACMIRFTVRTALVCSLRVRVSKKIRETFTSHI